MEINDFMRNRRKKDSVLPVIDNDGLFHGMYFAKDFRNLDPSFHNGKPVVGVAIGEKLEELEFTKAALDKGAWIILMTAVMEIAKQLLIKQSDWRKSI